MVNFAYVDDMWKRHYVHQSYCPSRPLLSLAEKIVDGSRNSDN